MAGTTSLADLALSKPDGSLLTRIEAETELREKCKIFHNMGLLASYHLGLENRFALGMTPTSVIHWVLDEMIRKRLIAGDQIGVQPELESDASYFNSYIQKLGVFVQTGQALMPKEGEGIDMSDFQQMPPNGQPPQQPQGFTPPPPPPMGYGQPQQPQQQQYQQPPQGMPPQNFGPPPGAPPQGFAPPQGGPPAFAPPPGGPPSFGPPPGGAPGFAPQGPPPLAPQMPPQGMPPQQTQAPQAPPAQAPSNRRRGKSADAGPPAPNGAPPQQQSMPFPSGPPQQAPQSFGAPQSGYGGPMGQPQQMQSGPQNGPQADTSALQAQISELKAILAQQGQVLSQLLHIVKGTDAAVSITMRPYYEKQLPQQPSQLGTEATFKEIGLPYPS